MGLDIRLPIGMLFTLLGALLVGYGLITGPEVYTRSLGHNVNLVWGLAMLAFGLLMLFLGRRGAGTMRPAEQSVEGRAIEEMELRTGKESQNPMGHH